MPMQNNLNVSEMLKRMGVVGDSQGSVSLLDQMRLSVVLADLSDLVAPLRGPIGACSELRNSATGTYNKWAVQCNSPGGLTVVDMHTNSSTTLYYCWVSDVAAFSNPTVMPKVDLSFGQPTLSVGFNYDPDVQEVPFNNFLVRGSAMSLMLGVNWIGPGQFFNIESFTPNVNQQMLSISWKEYPAGINP